VRPTSDRVRESVFGIIEGRLAGARVLDLFAGSGALGIESISRGAAAATFVERDPRAIDLVRRNVEALGLGEECRVLRGDALRLLSGRLPGAPFDVVFVDPPYSGGLAERTLHQLGACESLSPSVLVVVEHAAGVRLSDGYGRLARGRAKRYGDTEITFFETRDTKTAERGNA